jgi:MFS superfamily sulfate permease-like transporter
MLLQHLFTAITIEDIGYLLSFFAGILGSILTIWAFSSKVKQSRDDNISLIVTKALDEYNDKLEDRMEKKIACADKVSEQKIFGSLSRLEGTLKENIELQKEINASNAEEIDLLKQSLIETYKQDIRDIYYKLRETGIITDTDKSYIDKLMPKYTNLGGNSDVHAKYDEICRVYEKITEENFLKAREEFLRNKIKKEIKE